VPRKRDPVKCKGFLKNGRPCTQFAMYGQLVCRHHGGNSPQAKRKAHERMAAVVADEELAKLADLDKVRPVMNSLAELQWLAGLNRQWLERAAEALNLLTLESLRYEGSLHGEMLRAEVGIYERAMEAVFKTN
jgi:hypothetical protein